MSTLPDKEIIGLIARELATEEAFIEKDWHAVQVIAAITSLAYPDYQFVFAGGTALSKAHKLIHRFSEDIDFRLDPVGHSPSRADLSTLRNQIISALRRYGFTIDEASVEARNQNRYFTFLIRYHKQFGHSALRPDIKVEVTLDCPKLPVSHLQVSSLVASYTKRSPEVAEIACLAYVENAADKLSAALWRIIARVRYSDNDDPTLVRHVHDLAILKDAVIGDPNFAELARIAIATDAARINDPAFTALSLQEKFAKMLAFLEADPLYSVEYDQFVAGLSYAPRDATPDFALALAALRELTGCVS